MNSFNPIVLALSLLGLSSVLMYCTSSESLNFESMSNNYDENQKEIEHLIVFFDKNIPSDIRLDIELSSQNKIDIFRIESKQHITSFWDVPLESEQSDSLLNLLNWTQNDLEQIKRKMKEANCISISNFSNHTIGFQRDGLGKYNYIIVDPYNYDNSYLVNNTCFYIKYKSNVYFEYVSGATGSLCFPEKFRE